VKKSAPAITTGDVALSFTTGQPSSNEDFLIPAGTGSWNGATPREPLTGGVARAVRAGDIIELAAGNYPGGITLSNICPAASTINNPNTDYVTIRGPATGKANLTAASGTAVLLQINGCRFFVLDGESQTSAPDFDGKRRNIKITYTGTASPVQLMKCGEGAIPDSSYDQSRDYVIRYIEIDGNWPGSGAQGARIAFSTNGPALASNFTPNYGTPTQGPDGAWLENIIFEHNYVHNCAAEGIYMGHNASDANDPAGRAPPVRYGKIRYNFFRDVGGNTINPKSWFGGQGGPDQFPTSFDRDTNNSIHNNVIIRGGTNPIGNPPLGPAISCRHAKVDVYNNTLEGCGGWGISFSSAIGANVNYPVGVSKALRGRVYNNVVKGSTSNGGIQTNNDAAIISAGATEFYPSAPVYNNTVISNTGNGIKFDDPVDSGCFARNNIVLGNTSTAIAWGGVTNENSKNLITGTVSTAVFVDVTGSIEGTNTTLWTPTVNYDLSAAQLRDPSSVLNTDIASTDIEGTARVLASADMGAYEL
jgi:hypothetical protein